MDQLQSLGHRKEQLAALLTARDGTRWDWDLRAWVPETSINLGGLGASPRELYTLFFYLSWDSCKITTLSLWATYLGDADKYLRKAMQDNKSVQYLSLRRCKLSDQTLKALFQGLRSNRVRNCRHAAV